MMCGPSLCTVSVSVLLLLLLLFTVEPRFVEGKVPVKPNFVIFLADDLGYMDLHSFGAVYQEVNEIDLMIREGMMFKNFYAADSVCTPSRAALLTGRLPMRMGMHSHKQRFFDNDSKGGLLRSEITIAEMLSDVGYVSGFTGKWHLGLNKETSTDGYHLPVHHGFDYAGWTMPLSNSLLCDETTIHGLSGTDKYECFLYQNTTIVQQPLDHERLAERLTSDSVEFIRDNSDRPFFLYMSFPHTHMTVFASEDYIGKSRRKLYGDNVNEMAGAIATVLSALEEEGVENDTLVVFASDNGPDIRYCIEAGDPGLFRGSKFTFQEGGIHIPVAMRMPGYIPANSVNFELATLMDILPTFAELAGATLPDDLLLDGKSLVDTVFNDGPTPHVATFFFCQDILFAVRFMQYKIVYQSHMDWINLDLLSCVCPRGIYDKRLLRKCATSLDTAYGCSEDFTISHDPPLIFDIEVDPREMFPLPYDTFGHVMRDVSAELEKLKETVHNPSSVFLETDCTLIPCCDEETDCVCNYPGGATVIGDKC